MPLAIEARGLTKRYGNFAAVQALDLAIGQGEVFGFLGPNGAGKSTTTKILTTLIAPSAGSAQVGGHDVVADPLAVRRIIGYLPERVPVYRNMTAREFLDTFGRLHGLSREVRHRRIEALLKDVNLVGVERKAVGAFSKGMTQRLGLARALLNEPSVVFLDEPASGLDPTGRKEIRVLMRSLAEEGKTVFLCTHDLAEAQAVCDRIGFIRQGKLVQVQKVGEIAAGEVRILEVEVEGLTPSVVAAVRGMTGVQEVVEAPNHLTVRFVDPASRVEVARTIQKAGALVLGIQEKLPTVEKLYEQYVERGEPSPEGAA